jgi:tRNA(Ile)-lysidine synthase
MENSRKHPSAKGAIGGLERKVELQFGGEVRKARQVTVALSGGVDSIVLLEVLRALRPRLGIRIGALHVNHGLSPHADRWEQFCRVYCGRRAIPFRAIRVTVQGDGGNVEAEARAARYAALSSSGVEMVALAHNQDDQAETLLLQLLRGAGIRGLSAMPVRRELRAPLGAACATSKAKGPVFLRPLLGVTRAQIERYATRKRLRWIEDESNRNEKFARNFLRRRILPRLEQRFPGYRAALARSSSHLAEAGQLLEQLAAIDRLAAVKAGRLSVAALNTLGPARATNLLRFFLLARGLQAPATNHLREILHQLCSARKDANPSLQLGPFTLRRFKGWIELSTQPQVDTRGVRILDWSGESRVSLGEVGELQVRSTRGQGVSHAKLAGAAITIRRRRGGERIRLYASRPRRTLKNLLQEAGVPPWQRDRMPLLFCGEELVWVPGIGVAWEFRPARGERALLFTWIDSA